MTPNTICQHVCKKYTVQFANKSKKYVVSNILKYANTWDNYSLSYFNT